MWLADKIFAFTSSLTVAPNKMASEWISMSKDNDAKWTNFIPGLILKLPWQPWHFLEGGCFLQLTPVSAKMKKKIKKKERKEADILMKSSHECAVWHSLYPWSSSWHCSMMSSQITVWAMWIVALRVAHAAASSVLTSGGFIGSDSFSHALLLRSPTHSGFVSLPLLPLTFLYSGQLQ